MRIVVDRSRCIGVGHCVRTAADLFDSGEDGLVVVPSAEVDASRADEVREAAGLCPNAAISLAEEP